MVERCETCRFAKTFLNLTLSCRRYPPQLIVWPGKDFNDPNGESSECDERFPKVEPDDWCGEYQPSA